MKAAYGRDVDALTLWRGLFVAARALNDGDLARAMVASLRLRLPDLDVEQAARADAVLAKQYNPGEPRDADGWWTTGTGSNAAAAASSSRTLNPFTGKPMVGGTVTLDPVTGAVVAASVVSAVASGDTVTFTRADGTTFTQSGNRPARANNPLDIEWGATAKANGSVGKDGKFAIFPTSEQGFQAALNRFGTIASTYSHVHGQPDGSLAMLVYVWSPPSDNNNTEEMISVITSRAGLNRNDQWKSLTDDQRWAFLHAYARREGYAGPYSGK